MKACARCRRAGDLTDVLGKELCSFCCLDFTKWVDKGKKKQAQPPRAQVGAPWKIIRNLIAKHGSVTVEQYAAVTGQTGRTPYYLLRSFVRRGHLETDRMGDGTVTFFLSPSRWDRQVGAEAAE